MLIIFLDFDGVLAHMRYNPSNPGGLVDEFDPRCVHRLMQLLKATQAKVVIESTWAYVDTPEHIKEVLFKGGFDLKYLHDDFLANASPKVDKVFSVKHWLSTHTSIDGWLILDDETCDAGPQVKIAGGWFKGGLKDEHVDEALKILGPLVK